MLYGAYDIENNDVENRVNVELVELELEIR